MTEHVVFLDTAAVRRRARNAATITKFGAVAGTVARALRQSLLLGQTTSCYVGCAQRPNGPVMKTSRVALA